MNAELEIIYFGKVQGVGMRAFIKKTADRLKVDGFVQNVEDGSVEVFAQGEKEKLQSFLHEIEDGAYFAEVRERKITWNDDTQDPLFGFTIEE
jgi:acylphosphatase